MVDIINFDKIPFIGLTEKTFSKIGYLLDYVDSLYWDIVQYPVMWGYGLYGTRFIVIKCLQNEKKIMQTFYQRSKKYSQSWIVGDYRYNKLPSIGHLSCRGKLDSIFYSDGRSKICTFNFLEEFISKKSILPSAWVERDINPFFYSINIHNKIELVNDIKTKWEIMIEKIRLYNILSNNLTKFPRHIILKIINFVLI
jgi:hypothetical protein